MSMASSSPYLVYDASALLAAAFELDSISFDETQAHLTARLHPKAHTLVFSLATAALPRLTRMHDARVLTADKA